MKNESAQQSREENEGHCIIKTKREKEDKNE